MTKEKAPTLLDILIAAYEPILDALFDGILGHCSDVTVSNKTFHSYLELLVEIILGSVKSLNW